MTVDGQHGACPRWGTEVVAPDGYSISSDTRQHFRAGGRVTYVTLSSDATAAAAVVPADESHVRAWSAGTSLPLWFFYVIFIQSAIWQFCGPHALSLIHI